MKLLVLGATGGTGLEVVRHALDRGHAVTAFVRSAKRLARFGDRIEIKEGNLLNRPQLEAAIDGQDAVLSAFGPRVPIATSERNLLSEFASALTPAMIGAGADRVVVLSTAFLFKSSIVPPAYLVGKLLFPSVVSDAARMEETFRNSPLRWTILRPPRLTDGPASGKYRLQRGRLPLLGFSISRADVADCFFKVLDDPATVKTIVGASN